MKKREIRKKIDKWATENGYESFDDMKLEHFFDCYDYAFNDEERERTLEQIQRIYNGD